MELEKSDKLGEINTVITESTKPYFTDVFSPGETKEQLRVGKEVKDAPATAKKYCFINNSTTQSINDSSETIVTLGTYETNDTGMSATSSRVTITTAGQYIITSQVQFAGNSTGVRQLLLLKNGSRVTYNYATPNTTSIDLNVNIVITVSVGDYLQLAVYQTSTAALNINSSEGVTFLRVHQL